MLRRIVVTSATQAAKWRPNPSERYAIVSLVDVAQRRACLIPRRAGYNGRLVIRTDDVAPAEETINGQRLYFALTPKQADQIASFVDRRKSEIEVLLVHCHAGIARSPTVALAIAEAYDLSATDIEIMSPVYQPNLHVLALTRAAFAKIVGPERMRQYRLDTILRALEHRGEGGAGGVNA